MKFTPIAAAIAVALVTGSVANAAEVVSVVERQNASSQIVAFGLGDIIPSGGSDAEEVEDASPSASPSTGDRNATGTESFSGFSGGAQNYTDSFNGFKLKIPNEFQIQTKGATTNWGGPLLVGTDASGEEFTGGGLISVNTIEWSAGNPVVACNATVSQYKNDRFYPNDKISSKQVKFGNIPATVVFFEESIYQRGTRDEKNPDDHHRLHFQVCGNGRIYNGLLGYYYGFFKRNDVDVRAVFEAVRDSFELVPADNAAIGG